jgi:hypothetical protein
MSFTRLAIDYMSPEGASARWGYPYVMDQFRFDTDRALADR